jgi:hypothetical protein
VELHLYPPPLSNAFKAWKGTTSTYRFFLELLACPKTPECQSFTKMLTVNISKFVDISITSDFEIEFKKIEQVTLSSLVTSFDGMVIL